MADERKARTSWRVVLLSLCIACTFHTSAVQAQTVPAPSGLVTWWQAEGNASDRIGSNNGYLTTGTSFVAGKVGQAFSLDSSQEGVIVGNPAALQLQDLTIEAWVKRANPAPKWATLDQQDRSGVIFGYGGSGGYILGLLADGQLGFGKVGVNEARSGTLRVTDTNWHHVAVTKSGTTLVFYVDGASTTVPGYSSGGFTFGAQAAIGTGSVGLVQSFYGSIDEMSVYNRPLSAIEIQAIAAAPGGKVLADTVPATQAQTVAVPSGVVAWWQAEDNANDRIGSNNGTLIAGTSFAAGKVGRAFSLDSSPEGVIVGNPAALQLQDLTIEAWVKRASPAPGNATLERADWPGIIFGYGTGGYVLGLYPDGQLALSKVDFNVVTSGALAVTDTNWHHVAMTKSGTTVVFYWDGASTTISNYSSVFTFGTQAAIGTVTAHSPTQSFYGSIDEVSVYNRPLSATEIQAIAAAPGGKVFAYTVTATAGANGSISPSGAVVVNQGTSQTFTITPSTGYHTADVLADGSSVGAVSTYSFSNVTAGHTISASFAINTYTLTASAGAHGSISPSGAMSVSDGGTQAFTITADTGYHVADVLVDGSSVGVVSTYSFSNVTATHTISASFVADSYAITASAGANGSISPLGTTLVNANVGQSFAVTPNAGYHVADVLVDGVSVGAVSTYNFSNVVAGHTISASFAINSYSITASAGADGSISPLGATPVNHGGDQAFTITPDAGYHVVDVLVDGVTVGAVPSYTFTGVAATHTISASFAINTYMITSSVVGANGSITPSGANTVNHGGSQVFTITPEVGYHIADVLVDGISVGAVTSPTIANVTADHTIEASFAINSYTVTSSVVGANGSISPLGATTVSYGGGQEFTITPDAGYHIADVLVDGSSVGAVSSYTFADVTAEHTIAASFAINSYTLTASAGAGGSISPVGAIPVNHGGSQVFSITPAAGYHIADVQVDGISIGAVGSYAFTNVTVNHTIAVSFADQTPPIITLNGSNPLLLELGTSYLETGATASDLVDGDISRNIQISGGVNSNAEGSYTLTYSVSDAAGNSASASRTVQVVVTPNSYGLIATHSLHLRQNARVFSGFAGVVNRGQAPFLAGKVELVVGTNVQTGPEVRLSAPRVRVRKGVNIAGELVYNELVSVEKRATIADREQVPQGYFPLFQGFGLPVFQTGAPGTRDVEVKQKGTATLSAGAYGEIQVKQKGTITFTGGTYQLGDLEVGEQAKVIFLAPTTLLIRGQLSLAPKASFGPDAGMDATKIRVYVEGRNGRLGASHEDDEGDDEEDDSEGRRLRQSPRAVKVGEQASFQGNLYAPNGTLHLRQGSTAVGSFIARDIIVGVRVQVAALSGWNTPGVVYQPQTLVALAKLVGEQGATAALPGGTRLLANYPNPFNPSTTVPYVLSEAAPVKLSVYNVLGQQIQVLVDQLQVPGAYTVSWDGLDATGQQVAGGVYFYRLEAGEQHAVGRMLLLR